MYFSVFFLFFFLILCHVNLTILLQSKSCYFMVKIISFWKDIHSVKLGWSCCLFWLQRDNIVTMLQQVANLDLLTVLSDDNVTDCWNHRPKYQESVSPHDILKSSIKTKARNLGKRVILFSKPRREVGMITLEIRVIFMLLNLGFYQEKSGSRCFLVFLF